MPITPNYLYIGADMQVSYLGVKDRRTGDALPDGTVTWEVKTTGGVSVANGVLSYDETSDSDYYGTIPGDTALTDGTEYVVILKYEDDSGMLDERRETYQAVYRTKT